MKAKRITPRAAHRRAVRVRAVAVAVRVAVVRAAEAVAAVGAGKAVAAATLSTQVLPEDCFIRQRSPYRACAGDLIAYASMSTSKTDGYPDMRAEIDSLSDWIGPKLGSQARGWKT